MKQKKTTPILDCLADAEKSLRQLRELCESTARSGPHVREMQAYKNAVAAEIMIRSAAEIIA